MTADYAQDPHSAGGKPLNQDQKDYCAKHQIDPCTQNNILAKERIVTLDENADTSFQQFQMSDWLITGSGVGSIIAIAAVGIIVLKIKHTTHIDNV